MDASTNPGERANRLDRLPAVLKQQARFLRWRLETRPRGKTTKVPIGSVRSDMRTRLAFRKVENTPCDTESGVGFNFNGGVEINGARLYALDLDGCRDPVHETISPWAEQIRRQLKNSYAEVSPSGTGIRVFVLVQEPPDLGKTKVPVAAERPPNCPESKTIELQVFGDGMAQYVTVTGDRIPGASDIEIVYDLAWLVERYELGWHASTGDTDVPTGHGRAPSFEEMHVRISAQPHGAELIAGDWHDAVSGDGDTSASAAYHVLAHYALVAANWHGDVASQFLIEHTAWGRGEIEESIDPAKYTKERWVLRELGRVGAHRKQQASAFDDGFDATAWEPPPAPKPKAADASPIARLEHFAGWMDEDLPERRYLVHSKGQGVLPLGKAAVLAGAGGTAKTMLAVQAAVAVATGGAWLECFQIDPDAPRGVLMLLAEEDREEAVRRFQTAGDALGLQPEQKREIERHVTVLPLYGESTPLCRMVDEQVVPTPHYEALVELLARGGPWGLVVLDPLSRVAGVPAESANEVATGLVQVLERLCRAPGAPTVLLITHSSKLSRRAASADARGVTGLTDGSRWFATVVRDQSAADSLLLEIQKNNYGPLLSQKLLHRGRGVHSALSDQEEQTEAFAQRDHEEREALHKLEALAQRVAVAIAEAGGQVEGRELLAKRMSGRLTDCRAAVDLAVERGWIRLDEEGRKKTYGLPDGWELLG